MTSKPDASPSTPPPPPLTIREAAAYLGIGVRTAYDLARSGALPAVRIGRSWRVRLADLDALLTPHPNPGGATPSPGPATPRPGHGPATPTPQLPQPQPPGDGHPHARVPARARAPASPASVPADFIE